MVLLPEHIDETQLCTSTIVKFSNELHMMSLKIFSQLKFHFIQHPVQLTSLHTFIPLKPPTPSYQTRTNNELPPHFCFITTPLASACAAILFL